MAANPQRSKTHNRKGDQISVRDQVMRRDKNRCVYCGNVASTLDHVIPRCKGGANTLENLVASCSQCNQDKGDKPVDAFLAALPILLTDRAKGLLALAAGACDHWCQQQRHDGLFCFRCGAKLPALPSAHGQS